MISDAERREVARNIRENYVRSGLGYKVASAYNIAMAIGMNPGILVGDIELWNRLADLIEPPLQCPHYHSDRHYCSVYEDVQPIDRDALLALADELDKDADNIISAARNARFACGRPRMEEAKHDAYEWRSIARRIREGLGVKS